MSEKNNINENDLDKLLRQLYLKDKSENTDEAEAEFVFSREYNVPVNKEKEKQLLTDRFHVGLQGQFV